MLPSSFSIKCSRAGAIGYLAPALRTISSLTYFTGLLLMWALLITVKAQPLSDTEYYRAPLASTAPTIDGISTDAAWQKAGWVPIAQLYLGSPFTGDDFTGRFKVVWTPSRLYILVEATDNILSDDHLDPLDRWYDDDCVEIFLDENKSGGDHEFNYNAFAYHVATDYQVVDLGTDRNPHLYDDHVTTKRTQTGNVYTWEMSVKVFGDTYAQGGTNQPLTLAAGKKSGFMLAYCDNDETASRENFIGSRYQTPENTNAGYRNASIFATLELVSGDTPPTNTPPVASFTATPTSGTAPLAVAFNASASSDANGDVLTYNWTFGDGTSGTGKTISHSYTAAGNYTATLTVNDGKGGTNSKSTPIIVTSNGGNTAPVANFTFTPTTGVAPIKISFNASSSKDADGDVLTYKWNLGNGAYSAGKYMSYTYTTAGTYKVTLTVTDGKGGSNSKSATITITSGNGGNTPPVASFTATPTSGTAPLAVAFNASASSDANGDVLTYSWTFGDGTSGTGKTISHSYTAAGSYTATLTVNDGKGGTNNKSTPITVTSGGGSTSSLKVQYRTGNTNATDNSIQPQFQLVNTGAQAVPMSELKVRYWYTNEGGIAQTFFCDWAVAGSANVQAKFVKLSSAVASADHYLEVSFAAAAGSLAANSNSGDIQTRFNKNDYSNYNETGDYSFNATQTAYADWTKVTLYRNGQLVWGTEPAGAARLEAPSPETTSRLGVYPNPSSNQLTINYQAAEAGNAQVTLVNAKGEASIRENRIVEAGENSFQWGVSHLRRGVYVLTIQQGSTKVVKKVSLQ